MKEVPKDNTVDIAFIAYLFLVILFIRKVKHKTERENTSKFTMYLINCTSFTYLPINTILPKTNINVQILATVSCPKYISLLNCKNPLADILLLISIFLSVKSDMTKPMADI